ncbi:glycerate kinase [Thalassospira sp.]|uniref:glycerate kinase type-2 family protein n=1 Tax=Thalassospira sp. TaxID=1912094 RepID=UPI00352FF8FE
MMSGIGDSTAIKRFLTELFETAVRAADPDICVPAHLPAPPDGRTIVIGAGKASAKMARALEHHWSGPVSGCVVTRYGHAVPTRHIEIIEASHPVPDAAGLTATRKITELVRDLRADDLVICLISGGGSALLVDPVAPLDLAGLRDINLALLKSGAAIDEMNCVRRHISNVKGGRLAAMCHPARVVTLAISDVPGDSLLDVASGPTVADPTSCADALAIIDRYDIALPDAVRGMLENGETESIKHDDPRIAKCEAVLIATPQMALEAAAQKARDMGIAAHILGDAIEGEASDVGTVLAGIARQIVLRGQPFARPCLLLSGGETTVTVKGNGRGGRNVEFLLGLAVALNGLSGVYAIAGDTDGVDGLEEIAGGLITPDTLDRAIGAGIKAQEYLANNDGHSFFERLGDAVITGPTLTNVNDFRAILIN